MNGASWVWTFVVPLTTDSILQWNFTVPCTFIKTGELIQWNFYECILQMLLLSSNSKKIASFVNHFCKRFVELTPISPVHFKTFLKYYIHYIDSAIASNKFHHTLVIKCVKTWSCGLTSSHGDIQVPLTQNTRSGFRLSLSRQDSFLVPYNSRYFCKQTT